MADVVVLTTCQTLVIDSREWATILQYTLKYLIWSIREMTRKSVPRADKHRQTGLIGIPARLCDCSEVDLE